jgi:hypothetical protein
MYIKFSSSAHTRSNKFNIIYIIKSFNKRYQLAGGGRGIGLSLEDYFFQVQTSLELWSSSDVSVTTIAFLRTSSSAFFWASSFLRTSSFFLLASIYRVSAALSFLAC